MRIQRDFRSSIFNVRFGGPLALLLALLLPSPASAVTIGDIEVNPLASANDETVHGYADYSIDVTNRSNTASHEVELFTPFVRFGGGEDHIARASRTVTVGPGATVRVRLLQPPVEMHGRDLGVTIDGRTHREAISMSGDHMGRRGWYSSSGVGPVHLFISRAEGAERTYVEARFPASSGPSGYGHKEVYLIAAELPAAAWSDQWLSYSAFDAVMVTGEDLASMPGAVRQAVEDYVRAGGVLVVAGAAALPRAWAEDTASRVADFRTSRLGFGLVLAGEEPVRSWSSARFTALRDAMRQTAQPWEHIRGPADAHDGLPVVESVSVPLRGLFALMLAFAVVIGPVNLVVLGRMKRKIWLLWTAPAISLVTCGAVFAYNALAEGWTAYGRIQTITVLDQPARRAATIGMAGLYAPLGAGSLRFEADTELTPQIHERSYGYRYTSGSGQARTVDWTSGQVLQSGWAAPRVPAHFMLRRVNTERQRVDFTRNADGAYTATNGLRAAITHLTYVDAKGREHTGGPIAPGGKATLKPGGLANAYTPAARQAYASDWYGQIGTIPDTLAWKQPETYRALTESSPFIDPPMPGVVMRSHPSVVYGIAEPAAEARP